MRNQDPKATLSQISLNTKMCVGFRHPAFDTTRQALTFKTTIKPGVNNHVEITLNAGDLYDVKLFQTRAGVVKVTKEAKDIYCEDLSEVIYRICTWNFSEAEYNAVGIHSVKS